MLKSFFLFISFFNWLFCIIH